MLIVALRFVSNRMQAEDIVQESFIKAFLKIQQYKGEVTFGAWLKKIVVNKCIDHLKVQKQRLIDIEDHHLAIVDIDNDSSNWSVNDEVTLKQVKTAIEELPEKYKYVVMLFLIEGYDHQEISQILGISEVASRTQLLRGKQKLQQKLKHVKNGTRS